jgi:hypothetical protein
MRWSKVKHRLKAGKLFDTSQDAYNAAIRDEMTYNKEKDRSPPKHESKYIETEYLLIYNQYDNRTKSYISIYDVDKWTIMEVIKIVEEAD